MRSASRVDETDIAWLAEEPLEELDRTVAYLLDTGGLEFDEHTLGLVDGDRIEWARHHRAARLLRRVFKRGP